MAYAMDGFGFHEKNFVGGNQAWPTSSALRKSSKTAYAGFRHVVPLNGEKTLKQTLNIHLVRATNGEVLPGNPFSSVSLSSASTNWRNLVVEEHHFPLHELDDLMYIHHVVAVNVGGPITGEFKKDGRLRCVSKDKGGLRCFLVTSPFFGASQKLRMGARMCFM
jgi:hypothetical protein